MALPLLILCSPWGSSAPHTAQAVAVGTRSITAVAFGRTPTRPAGGARAPLGSAGCGSIPAKPLRWGWLLPLPIGSWMYGEGRKAPPWWWLLIPSLISAGAAPPGCVLLSPRPPRRAQFSDRRDQGFIKTYEVALRSIECGNSFNWAERSPGRCQNQRAERRLR